MDGEPGVLVGVEGVEGGGAGVAEGVEVVDQRDAAVLEGELRDGEDVLRFVEVVSGEAVGEALGLGVADPGLVDVGDDLVVGGGLGEAGGVGLEAGGLLVALVAVEDAEGDVDVEADGVLVCRCGRTRLRAWGRRCRWRWRGARWLRRRRRRSLRGGEGRGALASAVWMSWSWVCVTMGGTMSPVMSKSRLGVSTPIRVWSWSLAWRRVTMSLASSDSKLPSWRSRRSKSSLPRSPACVAVVGDVDLVAESP